MRDGQLVHCPLLNDTWPKSNEWNPNATFIETELPASQASGVLEKFGIGTTRVDRPIVARKDNDGVSFEV